MIETTLDITTKDSAMGTFVCHPERGGPYPVESPHPTFAQVKGKIYISHVEHDKPAPLDMAGELRRRFEAAGSLGEIELQAEAHHGFTFP